MHESKYLSELFFFFSNIKFAECTRRVYHLGYRIFLGVGGRALSGKLLPINKDCLDLIQNIKLESILELTWKNKMAIVLKNDRNILLIGCELSLFSTDCNW